MHCWRPSGGDSKVVEAVRDVMSGIAESLVVHWHSAKSTGAYKPLADSSMTQKYLPFVSKKIDLECHVRHHRADPQIAAVDAACRRSDAAESLGAGPLLAAAE